MVDRKGTQQYIIKVVFLLFLIVFCLLGFTPGKGREGTYYGEIVLWR